MAAKDFIFGNPSPEDEPNIYRWIRVHHNMNIILENWRQYLNEELDPQDTGWEKWHGEIIKNLKDDGYEPERFEKKAYGAYNDGYTTLEFEEEWLEAMGLL